MSDFRVGAVSGALIFGLVLACQELKPDLYVAPNDAGTDDSRTTELPDANEPENSIGTGAGGNAGGSDAGGQGSTMNVAGSSAGAGGSDEPGPAEEPPPGFDVYVDAARGDDAASGEKEAPLRTISRALEVAGKLKEPAAIYVAAGTYDAAHGERFPLVIRGLSVHGAGADRVRIQGSGAYDSETGSVPGTYFVTVVAGDAALPTSISGVTLNGDAAAPAPQYIGVFCDRGDAPATETSVATTLIEDAVLLPGYERGVAVVTSELPELSACNLRLRGTSISGAKWGVQACGCKWGTMDGKPVSIQVGDESGGNHFAWTLEPSNHGAGVIVQHCVTNSSIRYNTFVDSGTGVWIHPYDPRIGSSVIAVTHNTFRRLSWSGVFIRGTAPWVEELSDNDFEDVSQAFYGASHVGPWSGSSAVLIDGTDNGFPFVRGRRNRFVGNDSAITIAGPDPASFGTSGPIDFGAMSDPGENVFHCNGRGALGLGKIGGDVEVALPADGTLPLAGNVWDHAPPTIGLDGEAPDGSDVLLWHGPGLTVDVSHATTDETSCP